MIDDNVAVEPEDPLIVSPAVKVPVTFLTKSKVPEEVLEDSWQTSAVAPDVAPVIVSDNWNVPATEVDSYF